MFTHKRSRLENQKKRGFSQLFYRFPLLGKRRGVAPEVSQPSPHLPQSKITINQTQGARPVTVLHLQGALDRKCYQDLVATVRQLCQAGTQQVVLDMRDVHKVGSAGLLALHNIAVLLRGEEPLNPENGWDTLHAMAQALKTGRLQQQFKLARPQPQVNTWLEQGGIGGFLEIHPDLEMAIASF